MDVILISWPLSQYVSCADKDTEKASRFFRKVAMISVMFMSSCDLARHIHWSRYSRPVVSSLPRGYASIYSPYLWLKCHGYEKVTSNCSLISTSPSDIGGWIQIGFCCFLEKIYCRLNRYFISRRGSKQEQAINWMDDGTRSSMILRSEVKPYGWM